MLGVEIAPNVLAYEHPHQPGVYPWVREVAPKRRQSIQVITDAAFERAMASLLSQMRRHGNA